MHNDFKIQLGKLQEQINELKEEAEIMKKSNPTHAVMNARKACEVICEHICFKEKLIKDRRYISLGDKIYLISQNDLAPQHLLDDMRFIQKKGNTATHSTEKFNPEDAEPVLNSLSNLVNWYFSGTTLGKTDNEKPEGPSKTTTEIEQEGFLKTAKETFKKPWFKTLATTVMAAYATVLATKGLNKSKKDKDE
jgi:hypothetical protein